MDLCKPLCLKSHDIQKVQVLERQREGVKNGVSTVSAKRQWLVYNKWCPAPLRACTGRPQEDGCKERCGARSRSIVLKSSWEHNSAHTHTHHPPLPWEMMGCSHAASMQKVWAVQLGAGLPQGCICPAKAKSTGVPTLSSWSLQLCALSPHPSSFNKRLYLPLPLPSGLQQLISEPLTAAHCAIIRYVNPMCQQAT